MHATTPRARPPPPGPCLQPRAQHRVARPGCAPAVVTRPAPAPPPRSRAATASCVRPWRPRNSLSARRICGRAWYASCCSISAAASASASAASGAPTTAASASASAPQTCAISVANAWARSRANALRAATSAASASPAPGANRPGWRAGCRDAARPPGRALCGAHPRSRAPRARGRLHPEEQDAVVLPLDTARYCHTSTALEAPLRVSYPSKGCALRLWLPPDLER